MNYTLSISCVVVICTMTINYTMVLAFTTPGSLSLSRSLPMQFRNKGSIVTATDHSCSSSHHIMYMTGTGNGNGNDNGNGKNNNNANNNGDDFDDFSVDEMKAANDLTKEFYQQIKIREQQQKQQPAKETWEVKKKASPSSSPRNKNNNNNNNNKTTTPEKQNRKFTGRYSTGDLDSTGTPSAGLFATQNGTVYAVPGKSLQSSIQYSSNRRMNSNSRIVSSSSSSSDRMSPRDRMMAQEFNLVGVASNEVTLVVQGILVIALLSFAIYIGAAGGITDGSDRFGAGEGLVNEYNGMGESIDLSKYMNDDASITSTIEGVVKDESSSVWL